MNDETASNPPVTPEPEIDAPSEEFARALAAYEQRQSAAEAATSAEKPVAVGDRVKARVVGIGDDNVLVDFGGRSEGVVEAHALRNEDGSPAVAVGDELELYVIEAGDQVVLAASLRPDAGAALGPLRAALAAHVPVEGRVQSVNAGGLAVEVGGVRAFCPMSQIEAGFCADPSVYVGRTLEFLVTSIEESRGSAVLSRRQLLRQERDGKAKELLARLQPGDERDGTVRRLEPFGAFVDLGGIDGLVHVSEIRHERTHHPKEALKVGETVRVRVLKIEAGKDGRSRVGLSIKAATPDPWTDIASRYAPGQRVHGTVARLADFGAFIQLEAGIDGLVHVSEAAPHRIAHVRDALRKGQEIDAVVLSVDGEKRRIALSVRQASEDAAGPPREPVIGEVLEGRVGNVVDFGVFVDLHEYGARASGLLPRELTGEPREADLTQRFKIGQTVRVEVIELRQGKVRLGLEGGPRPAPRAPRPERPEGAARPERSDRPARGPRPERSARTERGEGGGARPRPERRPGGDRPRRDERTTLVATSSTSEAPTTMALALRKAMEEAKRKAAAKAGNP